MLSLLFLSFIHAYAADSQWACTTVSSVSVPIPYKVLNCTGQPNSIWEGEWTVGPMLFHVVSVDLKKFKLTGAAASAKAPNGLQTVADMAKAVPKAVAGINGGYFWRLDRSDFIDDVCFLKTRWDAEQPVSATSVNYGIGDGLMKINGTLFSSNCDLPGYNAPTAFVMNGTNSNIFVMPHGGSLGPAYPDVIAAGPNLVSWENNGPVYGVPWYDENLNRWEHSANTAIGLLGVPGAFHTLVLVVADGTDSCSRWDSTCGIEATPMAYFMKDQIGVALAMEMDQGGSSTMWINGLGIVNNNKVDPRPVFNGLFVTQ